MRREALINLFLLLLVGGLALFVWLTPEEQAHSGGGPLTTLNPAGVSRISISNGKGPRFVLQRDRDGWRMTEPYRVRANGDRIDSLLRLLSTRPLESFPLPDDRLAEFGLQPPLAELTFDRTRISFGGTHPYNHRRYLRIEERLYLINDIFPHHVLARAEEFVSRAPLPEDAEISQIVLPAWRLYRQQERWRLQPDTATTDPALLAQKAAAWRHPRVTGVVRAPATPPEQQVTIHLAGSATPLNLGLVRQGRRLLLVNQVSGLAYRLEDDSLLYPPGEHD